MKLMIHNDNVDNRYVQTSAVFICLYVIIENHYVQNVFISAR